MKKANFIKYEADAVLKTETERHFQDWIYHLGLKIYMKGWFGSLLFAIALSI